MATKVYILASLLFSISNTFSQERFNSKVYISATTQVTGQEFYIDILQTATKTKVLFKLKRYFNEVKFNDDKNVVSYRQILHSLKSLDPSNDTLTTYLNKLDSISKVYTTYDKDSIIISNCDNIDYIKLIKEIVEGSILQLQDDKNRIVLDGTTVKCEWFNKGQKQIIYSRSPSSTSNPYLNKLIVVSMDLYRNHKRNDFLNKEKTSGY
jgi:hypothetical protein